MAPETKGKSFLETSLPDEGDASPGRTGRKGSATRDNPSPARQPPGAPTASVGRNERAYRTLPSQCPSASLVFAHRYAALSRLPPAPSLRALLSLRARSSHAISRKGERDQGFCSVARTQPGETPLVAIALKTFGTARNPILLHIATRKRAEGAKRTLGSRLYSEKLIVHRRKSLSASRKLRQSWLFAAVSAAGKPLAHAPCQPVRSRRVWMRFRHLLPVTDTHRGAPAPAGRSFFCVVGHLRAAAVMQEAVVFDGDVGGRPQEIATVAFVGRLETGLLFRLGLPFITGCSRPYSPSRGGRQSSRTMAVSMGEADPGAMYRTACRAFARPGMRSALSRNRSNCLTVVKGLSRSKSTMPTVSMP